MIKIDARLLEEAYLSISKKTSAPLESSPMSEVGTEPNSVVSVGPMDEPAPGVNAPMDGEPVSPAPTAVSEPSPLSTPGIGAPEISDDLAQEDEEDQMTLDNLNSVRESIIKIAAYCGSGGHLEIWAQQKLAIAMDNLAEVARRLH